MGKPAILRSHYSEIVESARAKMMPVVPEAMRKSETRIIDVMDGMAFVEITLANARMDVQMASLDGQWKIFNILTKRMAPPR
jgi:hypothetical protein